MIIDDKCNGLFFYKLTIMKYGSGLWSCLRIVRKYRCISISTQLQFHKVLILKYKLQFSFSLVINPC